MMIQIVCCLLSSILILATFLLHRRNTARDALNSTKEEHTSPSHENPLNKQKNENSENYQNIYKRIQPKLMLSENGSNLGQVNKNGNKMNLERFVLSKNLRAQGLKYVQTDNGRLDSLPKRSRAGSLSRSQTSRKLWILPRNSTYDSFHSNKLACDNSLVTFPMNSSPKIVSHGDSSRGENLVAEHGSLA